MARNPLILQLRLNQQPEVAQGIAAAAQSLKAQAAYVSFSIRSRVVYAAAV